MSLTDPIADFLTRVRNGLHADRDEVETGHEARRAGVGGELVAKVW
jgi:ribosomal protein S8